jgi:hypothetical protein
VPVDDEPDWPMGLATGFDRHRGQGALVWVDAQTAAGSAVHLCRLVAGSGRGSVRLSAWLVDEWQGTPTNVAPDEHDDIRWFRLQELPPFAHEILGTALAETMRDARA